MDKFPLTIYINKNILSSYFKKENIMKFKLQKKERESPKFELPTEEEIATMMDIGKDLDEELDFQSALMSKFSTIFGKVYEEYMISELEVGIIKDQLGEDMRDNPEKWGIKEKKGEYTISEQLIARRVHGNTRYQNAYKKFAYWKARRKEWEGHLEAVKQRSFSINAKVNRI
jgi:hypothetical protein